MNADERGLKSRELTNRIIGIFFDVYNELGYGFLESVYEEAMVVALRAAGLRVDRQVPLTVQFRGAPIGSFRADIVVEGTVVLELKAGRQLEPAHEAQLLNYLRASPLEVGILFNFGPRPTFRRVVFDNRRKGRQYPRSSAFIRGPLPQPRPAE